MHLSVIIFHRPGGDTEYDESTPVQVSSRHRHSDRDRDTIQLIISIHLFTSIFKRRPITVNFHWRIPAQILRQ